MVSSTLTTGKSQPDFWHVDCWLQAWGAGLKGSKIKFTVTLSSDQNSTVRQSDTETMQTTCNNKKTFEGQWSWSVVAGLEEDTNTWIKRSRMKLGRRGVQPSRKFTTRTDPWKHLVNKKIYPLWGSSNRIWGVKPLEQWLDFIQFMSGGPPVGLGTSGFYCLFVVAFI